VAGEREQFRQEFIKATADYEASLKTLADSYEESLKKLTEQNAKLKGLYTDGLISRRDMEASDGSVAAARAQLEDARKQIEQAATALAAASKSPSAEDAPNLRTGASQVARDWTTGNKSIDNLIKYYGGKYGVDPYLVYCVMHQESRFGSGATSYKGAMGLMQLMPGTAERYGVTNSYDPAQNIMGGTRYLKDLLNLFGGRIDLVLAGYNAGEGAVMKYGNRIPPYAETQAYVRIIGSRYGQPQHVVQPTLKKVTGRAPVKTR
jgi:soluble lytic murein transglycosylase-like protein